MRKSWKNWVGAEKLEKTGVRKNPKYGLYKGRLNHDFWDFYSPLVYDPLGIALSYTIKSKLLIRDCLLSQDS